MAFESSICLKRDYYIYFLYDKNNVVRYIGRGHNRRYKDYSNRSGEYKNIVDSGGRSEIIVDSLSKSEATELEGKYLRMFVGSVGQGFNLVNKMKYGEYKQFLTYDECSSAFTIDDEFPYLRYTESSKTRPGKLVRQKHPRKYATIPLKGVSTSMHRIIWVLYNKKDLSADFVVDHIDSDNTNNCPTNLQVLPQEQNVRKAKLKSDTGFVGVTLDAGVRPRYIAVWTVDHKQYRKSFGLRKYGKEEAFRMACEHRVLMQQKYHGDS